MYISRLSELRKTLLLEKQLYIPDNLKKRIIQAIRKDLPLRIWKFQRQLRISEYLMSKQGLLFSLLFYLSDRIRIARGIRLGIEIEPGSVDFGLKIYHTGIIINRNSKIGKNCKLHGFNCIGNKGIETGSPTVGDNVDIGVGACIIGSISVADDCIIGANSLVNKSMYYPAVLVGSPAKEIRRIE